MPFPLLCPTKSLNGTVTHLLRLILVAVCLLNAGPARRLEELSEKLCGHSLKLRCLEGLWRETGSVDCNGGAGAKVDTGDSKGNTTTTTTTTNEAIGAVGDEQNLASTPAVPLLPSRLSGFLKRLGSKSSSSSPSSSSSSHQTVPPKVPPETTPGPVGGGVIVQAQSGKSPAPIVETRESEEGDDRNSEDDVSGENGGGEEDTAGADAAKINRTESDDSSRSSTTSDSSDKDRKITALPSGKTGTTNIRKENEGNIPTSSSSDAEIDRKGERPESENKKEKSDTDDYLMSSSSSEKAAVEAVDSQPPGSGSSSPSAASPPATNAMTPNKTAVDRGEELQNDGIEDDSAHSRWGLPEVAGTAGGLLGEQRAVWGGGGREDDSAASGEQAPSDTESGERGSNDKSPRSRVESYDLQVRCRIVGSTISRAPLCGLFRGEGELHTKQNKTKTFATIRLYIL